VLILAGAAGTDPPARRGPREALKAFNDLIGSWRGTGIPEGTREQKQRGFWTETLDWAWQFQGDDAWLKVAFDNGKYFAKGELRYLPDKDLYRFTVQTADQRTQSFEGPLKDNRLVLDRLDETQKQSQRLTVILLHANRFLYRYEVKPQEQAVFKPLYQVGATKEGVPFAEGDGKPECVVTGGLGTIKVVYQGKTYYVCCSGCRDVFKDDPEKFIKEYEERKAREKNR
jgi:hypothetical protein